ncbi:hypothetical protein OHA77_29135 [Streptosporangium sp. NBC_01639]|uniref:hypothetical protein n=1 Tax=Streptosporangium sp. NBC_01639 TaxID=2975948 RepID=UPI0038703ADF|nr:hypothetical protein OHA77_29135 [Streptosporangium sp. NBC_01639]
MISWRSSIALSLSTRSQRIGRAPAATIAPPLVQPVAPADVADVLAEIAEGIVVLLQDGRAPRFLNHGDMR